MYILQMHNPTVFIKAKHAEIILYTGDEAKALKFPARLDALRFAEKADIVSKVSIIHKPTQPCPTLQAHQQQPLY